MHTYISMHSHTHTFTHSTTSVAKWLRRRLESRRSQVRIPFVPRFFQGRVIPVTLKLALQWLPCQAYGVIGSVLGPVGQVSAYCGWVRWKV